MTGVDAADERVLFINLGFFRYGCDDKSHAAALVFSFFLLVIIVGIIFGGIHGDAMWTDKVFTWVTGAFLFVAGVAIGKGSEPKKSKDE